MNQREIAIARRLRQARKRLGLSQSAVAKSLQVTRERLASYERLRAPVKWRAGFSFCLEFGVSLEWLATGKGPFRSKTPTPGVVIWYAVNVPGNPALGAGYDKYLAVPVGMRPTFDPDPPAQAGREILRKIAGFWAASLDDEEVGPFVRYIWGTGERYRNSTRAAKWAAQFQSETGIDPFKFFTKRDKTEANG